MKIRAEHLVKIYNDRTVIIGQPKLKLLDIKLKFFPTF